MNHKVFVYGTLRFGHGNWNWALNTPEVKDLNEGLTTGNNFVMTGSGIPFVWQDVESKFDLFHGHVRGDLFEVSRSVLNRLDQLEGHPEFYTRTLVEVEMQSGEPTEAWIYQCVRPEHKFMPPNSEGHLMWVPRLMKKSVA